MKPFEILPVHFNWRGHWELHYGWHLFLSIKLRPGKPGIYVPEFN